MIWVCPHPRCDNYAIGDDLIRVTCTCREPHMAERRFPEMVPLPRLKAEASVLAPARNVIAGSGNRACREGESPRPHVEPRAFARLVRAVSEASRDDAERTR